ncbi:MAG: hypothetical protein Q4B26_07990 [Eubacteriales bacterium]|nr:hypothetical protein [Eubacteriales bacterium]
MNAKEYLGQVKSKEARIKNLRRDKDSIKEMMYSLGGSQMGERVQSSRNYDKLGALYGRMDEMEREIDDQIAELMLFKLKVSGEINRIRTDKYMTVLNCRYIHFMTWEEIAENGFEDQYSVRHILKMHGLALLEFQEVYKEMLKNEVEKSGAVH